MGKNSTTKWAENLTKEVYKKWKRIGKPKAGFRVFYGPVTPKPKLMIISLNPGGSKKYFDKDKRKYENGDFSFPLENFYLKRKNRFGKMIMKLFKGNESVMEESVITTVLLFRSHDLDQLKRNKKKYAEIKEFANKIVKEIIEVIRPKKILVIGNETFDRMKKIQEDIHNEKIKEKFGSGGTILRAKTDHYDILVLPHVSAAHLTLSQRETMKKYLKRFIK